MKMPSSHRAATLLEILIYFTLLGVFLAIGLGFAIQLINVSQLASNLHELETTSEFIAQSLSSSIRQAVEVDETNSTFDVGSSVLSLSMDDMTQDPSIFYVDGTTLYLQQGSGAPVALHGGGAVTQSFTVHRSQYDKAPDILTIDLVFGTPSQLTNTDATLPVHMTVTMRP